MDVCQQVKTDNLVKLVPPPCFKFFRQNILEQICYFLYQEIQPNHEYDLWMDLLFKHTPAKYTETLYKANCSQSQLLNYISIKLNVKITILQNSRVIKVCPTVPCSLNEKHSNKCSLMTVLYNSYYTHIHNCYEKYIFIFQKGKKHGLYLLNTEPDFPILSTNIQPKSLDEIENLFVEKYNVPKFSFLNKLKSDPLENQDTYVEIYAADSLFTGNVDNIHRIGNFIYYSMLSNFNPWYFLAKWGQGSPEKVVYLVLVYSPHEGWQCVYDIPLNKPSSKMALPLKAFHIERSIEHVTQLRQTLGSENNCPCDRLSDFYISTAKHRIFKPVGHGENKCLATLLQIIGWYNSDIENILDQVIKLSVISFDIESLCVKETSIPMKKIGFASKDDNTYFDGKHVVETQVPYIIGTALFDIEQCINKFDYRYVNKALKKFIKGTCQEDYMSKTLELNFPENSMKQLMDSIWTHPTTKIFHIGENHKNPVQTEPDNTNIEDMVIRWLRYCYEYAKIGKLLKGLLLKNLMERLQNVIDEMKEIVDRQYSDVFTKALLKCEDLIKETFLISFNGANYDLPLIEKYLWNAAISCKFRMNLFKKSTSIQSVNINITQWLGDKNCTVHLTMKDVRNLEEPNVNLATLGKKYNLDEAKGLFPHSLSTGVQDLKETLHLPPANSSAWYNLLSNSSPNDAEIEQAHIDFQQCSAKNLYQYALHYLEKDVLVLFKVFFEILKAWNLSGVNIVLAR